MEERGRKLAKASDHKCATSNVSSYTSDDDAVPDAGSRSRASSGKRKPSGSRKKRVVDLLRGADGERKSHLRWLISERRARQKYLRSLTKRQESKQEESGKVGAFGDKSEPKAIKLDDFMDKKKPSIVSKSMSFGSAGASEFDSAYTYGDEIELGVREKKEMKNVSNTLKQLLMQVDEYKDLVAHQFPIEVRMDQLTYSVPVITSSNKIQTVYNSSLIYKVVRFVKDLGQAKASQETVSKHVLDNISLCLKPGNMYLILGAPGSGKSTLLKAIAGRLSVKKGEQISGRVCYNGLTFKENSPVHIDNAVSFIDQLDRHEPRLTVDETFEFAFQCKRGGTHNTGSDNTDAQKTNELVKLTRKADTERLLVEQNLNCLGLDHVRDTFVGDDLVRGVSGGQRRRVTVGEMMLNVAPIMCGDEISNGLDASSTYEIIHILSYLSKDTKKTRVISLLQPSPETVSLFDEVILLAEGKLIFAGPISRVEDYFAALGYKAPKQVDVADFLQLLTTADAEKLYEPSEERSKPYTADELANIFRDSVFGESITQDIKAPSKYAWASSHEDTEVPQHSNCLDDSRYRNKYANSFPRSVWLNLKRNITVWTRNRRVLIANAVKNIIMGVSVGGVFFQTDDVVSILGVLFQGMLFIMLGKYR